MGHLIQQLAEFDLRLLLGADAAGLEVLAPPGERVDSGIRNGAVGPARQSLYVTDPALTQWRRGNPWRPTDSTFGSTRPVPGTHENRA
jgi:hypothetical protein